MAESLKTYKQLCREIARERPDTPLTAAQIATLIELSPDVVAEAVTGFEGDIASVLAGRYGIGDTEEESVGFLFTHLLRVKCAAYIKQDVAEMRETLAEEDRIDARHERGVTA